MREQANEQSSRKPIRIAPHRPKPQSREKPFTLSAAHHKLLLGLHTYYYLKADQLTRLYYSPGSLTTVKARLKVLTDAKYTQNISLPTTKSKSPYIYTLATKGIHYLKDAGYDFDRYYRPNEQEERTYHFLTHTLELNDLLIAAALVPRINPQFALLEMRHDLSLKRDPFTVSIERPAQQGGTYTQQKHLVPDAWLDFRYSPQKAKAKGRRYYLWVELDRGTTEMKRFRQKIEAILAFLAAEGHRTLLHASRITIIFATTAGSKRLEQMRSWTRHELGEQNEFTDWFLFAALSEHEFEPGSVFLSPVWYGLEDDEPVVLLEG